ncbi:MAG: hypothetical protein B6D76_17690 [gamma proteobacterium symbiont of Stewartia floridana]|nr:MAG: hypothetical protein B6D76_17690 [gamma proteobacterium symbiont of Stewartia floridana]
MDKQVDFEEGHALPSISSSRRRKQKNLYKGQIGQYGQNVVSGEFNQFGQGVRALNNEAIDRENNRLYKNNRRQLDPMSDVMHHPHDRNWILEQVVDLVFLERIAVLNGYSARWLEAFNAEIKNIKKEGAARFSANTWLRVLMREKTDI